MPVKADKNSTSIQFLITNGSGFHHPLGVVIKNSNVMVQPSATKHIHISLHPETKKGVNSHLRIESGEVDSFWIDNQSSSKNGKLIQWKRKILDRYDCPLELRFPSRYAVHEKVEIDSIKKTVPVYIGEGTLIVNFWFTTLTHDELSRSFQHQGLNLVLFEIIEKTGENFALTYWVEADDNYDKFESAEGYREVDVSYKEDGVVDTQNKVHFMFGLSPKHKKLIIFG
jgi:hypothetical protein